MEYDPEQIELLIQKVDFTLGSRLEGLFYQQKNILENHLNQLMIDPREKQGQLLQRK